LFYFTLRNPHFCDTNATDCLVRELWRVSTFLSHWAGTYASGDIVSLHVRW